jgi:hypothetical protein
MFALHFQLLSFRRSVPEIRDSTDMDRFKRLAAFQMGVARFILPLFWLPIPIWLCAKLFTHSVGWLDLIFFAIVPMTLPFILSAMGMAATANRVRATPAADSTLTAERDHISHVWVHEKYPDWQ